MSDPNRYNIAANQAQCTLGSNILVVDPNGQLVAYEDYARLQAELTDLKSTADRLKADVNYWRIEAETDHARWLRVLEENDRLRKLVGMQESIDAAIDAWIESKKNAAKDGKPTA